MIISTHAYRSQMALTILSKNRSCERLMENAHPVVFNGTKPGTRPEGVGTELSEAKVKKSSGVRRTEKYAATTRDEGNAALRLCSGP